MSMNLNTVFNHANAVDPHRANTTNIYVNDQGAISNSSGLGLFRFLFSSSAKRAENMATLTAFKRAIESAPEYRTLQNNAAVTIFFNTKQAHGTPLTAADVKHVKGILHAELLRAEQRFFGESQWADFSTFCQREKLPLLNENDIKVAMQRYLGGTLFENILAEILNTAALPPNARTTFEEILRGGPLWNAAMNHIFSNPLNSLTRESVVELLKETLSPALTLLQNTAKTADEIRAIEKDSINVINKLTATVELMGSGALLENEATAFFTQAIKDARTFDTPQDKYNAALHHCIQADSEALFTQGMQGLGYPPAAVKALAQAPEFLRLAEQQLRERFPDLAQLRRENVTAALSKIAQQFIQAHTDTFQKIIAFVNNPAGVDPALDKYLQHLKPMTLENLSPLLPLLLSAEPLLNHLADPHRKSDSQYLHLVENFQRDVHQYGAQRKKAGVNIQNEDTTGRILALLLAANGVNGAALNTFFATTASRSAELRPSTTTLLGSVNAPNASSSLMHVQNGLQALDIFARQVLSQEQQEALDFENALDGGFQAEEAQNFMADLPGEGKAMSEDIPKRREEFVPDAAPQLVHQAADNMSMDTMHEAVKHYAKDLAIPIDTVHYQENVATAEHECRIFFGPQAIPHATEELRTLVQQLSNELHMEGVDVDVLCTDFVRDSIQNEIASADSSILTPAEARERSTRIIRKILQQMASALNFINTQPTVANPQHPELFYITLEEKQMLLKTLPLTTVHSEEDIRACVTSGRAMQAQLRAALRPGSSPAERYQALSQLQTLHGDAFARRPMSADNAPAEEMLTLSLALALDRAGLDAAQKKDLLTFFNSEEALELGRSLYTVGGETGTDDVANARHTHHVSGVVGIMHKLRVLLAAELHQPISEPLSFYQKPLFMEELPAYIWRHAFPRELRSPEHDVLAALALPSPPLTGPQRDVLTRILNLAVTGSGSHTQREVTLRLVVASAREIIRYGEAHPAFSLRDVWRLILGESAPRTMNSENFADKLCARAIKKLHEHAEAANPHSENTIPSIGKKLYTALAQGISFRTLCMSYRPGNSLSLDVFRLGKPTVASMENLNESNAFGLTESWPRRQRNAQGEPSTTIIYTKDGGSAYEHTTLPPNENTSTNPIYVSVIKDCKDLCHSDAQSQRLLQCLGQSAINPMRDLSALFPGANLHISEHTYLNCTVTRAPNVTGIRPGAQSVPSEDVIVQYTNGENDKPWGIEIQLRITPSGTVTYEKMDMQLRG